MVLVRRIHKRNANIVVEANGEVLFAPTGQVGVWTNRFSHRVRTFAALEAPANKRPRWGHYGKPLKSTFTASTTYQPGRMKVYSAIGSTSPHAYYVDQGTGIFAGNGPYPAKVIPPWYRGSPSLYENTWRPGGPGTRRVAPVLIKGQKGQFFFDAGLKRGFASMRMRSFQVPGEGQITQALSSIPTGLAGFLGNTPPSAGFRASLAEWRSWRDNAFMRHDRLGNRVFGPENQQKPRAKALRKKHGLPARQKKALDKAIRDTAPKKPDPTKKPKRGWASVADKKKAALAQFHRQNPHIKIVKALPSGIVVQTANHGQQMIPWSRLYGLID